jgi:uncharacterized protein (DUF427 family)
MQEILAEARTRLRHEPIERRVRARLGEQTVVDSTRAMLVWEPRRIVPSFAVPAEDIDAELPAAPAANGDAPGVLHPGIPFEVHTAAGRPVTVGDRVGAGFLPDDLPGHVVLDFDAFDAWYEEDEEIFGHPRDPFHRVDVRQTSRPVRIELDGEVLAETTRARLVFETSLMTRFYLPREDVSVPLEPHSRRTYCPYKGRASYWSAGRYEAIAWSYEQPLPDMAAVTGLIAFWDELVDVYLDGELRRRPSGPFAEALRKEFGLLT